MLGEVGFESLRKFASGQHDSSSTAFTFQSDIGAQADHGPFVGTAWMLFSQAQVVVQLKVRKHVDIQ